MSLGLLDGGEATIYEFDSSEKTLSAQRDIYLQAGLGRIYRKEIGLQKSNYSGSGVKEFKVHG